MIGISSPVAIVTLIIVLAFFGLVAAALIKYVFGLGRQDRPS